MKTRLYIFFSKVGPRLIAFPACEVARTFAKIEATKTLTGRALAIARELGFEIVVVPSAAGSAANLAAYLNPDGRAS